MGDKKFLGVGVWKLVSDENIGDNGSIGYPIGKDAVGQIIYDAKGYMAAQVGSVHRPPFAILDRLGGTKEELQNAFEGYTAYFGTYTVDEKNMTVTHHVQSSLFPNWTNTDQVRYYEFSGNRLILKTKPFMVGGNMITAVVTWERIS